jgi:nucleoside-diphosphate-sugar epimerase
MRILITGGSGFIGTNLIELLLSENVQEFINVDKQKPFNSEQKKYWIDCNIIDTVKLKKIFDEYKPTHIVHLAARTDTASERLEDYYDNTIGSKSLLTVIENSTSVTHTIITSTQYVYKSKQRPFPVSDIDFKPHTAYGFSKKLTEEYTRDSTMNSAWTIVRPTNVWGPWHMRYPNELWMIIDKGLYFHPGNEDPIKSYAYVKNVAYQIYKILLSPIQDVDKQVYYVGDYSMRSKKWLNAITVELTGKKIKIVPKHFLFLLSVLGTVLNKMNIRFPLSILRFENMIDDYDTPIEKTIRQFGLSHPDLEVNVRETIEWVKNDGKHFFPYWSNK